jgi:hypothetical protein
MFSLRSLRDSMAITSQALSRVAKDTPGLAALINTQTDITDILDPRIPYDTSSRRHILSLSPGDDHHASSSLAAALQRELNQLNRRRERRAGGSYAINFLNSLQVRVYVCAYVHVPVLLPPPASTQPQPDDGGMPRTRKEEKLAAERKV